jgi:hypothetical protein
LFLLHHRFAARRTSSETVVVWLVEPLVPVTVMVCVPVVARRDTVMVMVELPEPVMELGLKLTLTPEGWPEADKETAESKPPVTAEVIVTEPELLRLMLMEEGDAEIEKPAEELVTVSETVVEEVVLPDVPVMVIEYVPAATLDATVKVAVDEPLPVIEAGLKPTVTPEGWPEAERVTAESKPPLTVLVIVEVPELPATTETELGEAERVKPELVDVPSSALRRPSPFGLPQPVARS